MIELRTDRLKLFDVFPEKAKRLAKSLHKKADQIEFVRKGIPIDPTDIKIEDGERAAIRLITTPRLDRDNEILIPEGAILDDFRQSPSVLYGHDYKGLPIGRDQWLKVTKRGILAKTQYANHAFAEDVYQCVKGGFLNSNSVGFIPLEAVSAEEKKRFGELQDTLEKDYGVLKEESGKAKNIYTKWILLEHSDVPVASNAQSLNLAVSKGELPITSDRLKKDLGIVLEDEPEQITVDITPTLQGGELKFKIEPEQIKIGDEPGVLNFQLEEEVEPIVPLELSEEDKQRIMEKVEKFNIEHKPETTDSYHRIPVEDSGKHKDHRIRTITISASKGIKALYCGDCKTVITYLFDVDKFSMEEARAWVEDHKEFVIVAEGPEAETKASDASVTTTAPNVDIVLKVEEVIKKHGEAQMSLIADLQAQVIELRAGRILPPESREQIQKCLDEMRRTADRLEELYEAVEPRAQEAKAEEKKPDAPDFHFDPPKENDGTNLEQAVARALEKCLKPEFLSGIVKEAVEIKIKHLQGKVE